MGCVNDDVDTDSNGRVDINGNCIDGDEKENNGGRIKETENITGGGGGDTDAFLSTIFGVDPKYSVC